MENKQCKGDGSCLSQTGVYIDGIETYEHHEDILCEYNCMPQPCPNFIFCTGVCPHWVFDCHEDFCMSCAMCSYNDMEIFETDEECVICMQKQGKMMKFPAGCGHSFCGKCTRNIMKCDDSLSHLSQVYWGGPPCPNGCDNPFKGRQCGCDEYVDVIEEWSRRDPEQYEIYCEAEEYSIQTSVHGFFRKPDMSIV